MVGATGEPAAPADVVRKARRQLRRVLWVLAAMDAGVLVTIVALAVAAFVLRLTNLELLLLIVAAVGAIIGARVALAVRLRRRSGDI